ncbi:MAG: lysophospholipid acyltransferase family protein [Terriglobales bacterium]
MRSSSAAVEPEEPSVLETRHFSLRQRIVLWLISWASYLAISLIGPTLRYSISWEETPSTRDVIFEKPMIYSFWHRAVFPSAWLWRRTGIAVMVSRSFDGEYIARTLEKLGFIAVRGSSSRDGAKALLGLRSQLQKGTSVVFTIDGPRGPKNVAKPGPVLLSRASNIPMAAFYVALGDAWVLNTWDAMMIPKPFSKALVRLSAKIQVPAETKTQTFLERDNELADFHRQLQAALERVTAYAEEHVGQVGSAEFPLITS